jgi:hypothetical protein
VALSILQRQSAIPLPGWRTASRRPSITRSVVSPRQYSSGLRSGSYATTTGELSPLQAQIDLALPPNRGLPDALFRIDLNGLRNAGYEIPPVTRVGRSFNMPGGEFEMRFPYEIPSEFVTRIR